MKEISIKALEEKKSYIEKALNNEVYIDLYKDSIYETVCYNKNILSLEKDNIKCINKINKYVVENINHSLPRKIRSRYLNELAK